MPTGKPSQDAYRLRWEEDGVRRQHTLTAGGTTLGAARDNVVVLSARQVSRRHAVVVWDNEELRVRDLGSRNGTTVNGVAVTEAALTPGDTLGLGPVLLRLEVVEAEDAALAIQPATAVPVPADPTDRGQTSTPCDPNPSVPAKWLRALGKAIPLLQAEGDLRDGLDRLAAGLGLGGLALVSARPGREAAVLAQAGAGFPLDRLVRLAAAVVSPPEPTVRQLDGDPPLVAAVAHDADGRWTALGAWGEPLVTTVAGPVLLLALEVLRAGRTTPLGPDAPTRRRFAPAALVLPPGHVVGVSAAMRRVYMELKAVAAGTLPVLITGETGVGKEHVARILHLSSPRRDRPFEAVNCAAIPAELLEAELFGIERGVATGVAARDGRLRTADGGTLLLDEISEMPLPLQAKLLRALQEREVHAVGARRPYPVSVRVAAATNREPRSLLEEGRIRRDLYYRIAGCTLEVPALRERPEDVPALVEHFLAVAAHEAGRVSAGVTVKALRALQAAPWPGNVRQLEHEVRRLVHLCPPGEPVTWDMLSAEVRTPSADPPGGPSGSDLDYRRQVEALERRLLATALAESRGNHSEAARHLGLSRNGLTKMMRRLGLDAGR